jgi:hypothetical protein
LKNGNKVRKILMRFGNWIKILWKYGITNKWN